MLLDLAASTAGQAVGPIAAVAIKDRNVSSYLIPLSAENLQQAVLSAFQQAWLTDQFAAEFEQILQAVERDPERYGAAAGFQASTFTVSSLDDVRVLHYGRNALLVERTPLWIIENAGVLMKRKNVENAFHQGEGDNEHNEKWLSLDGRQEYILRLSANGYEIVDGSSGAEDHTIMGTYNFSLDKDIHMRFDVHPWILWGSSPQDQSSFNERWSQFYLAADDYLANWAFGPPIDFEDDDPTEGDASPNHLLGGAERDSIFGFAGNDTLNGGADADSLYGGDGIDAADYANASTGVTVNLTERAGYRGDAATDNIAERLYSIENIYGSNFPDIVVGNDAGNDLRGLGGNDILSGRAWNDSLYGGAGRDELHGGIGNDLLKGEDHEDWLRGEGDNDEIYGDGGADTLDGGTGSDTLHGGPGGDVFHLTSGTGAFARIPDYRRGDLAGGVYSPGEADRIDVSAFTFATPSGRATAAHVRVIEDTGAGFASLQLNQSGGNAPGDWATVARLDGLQRGQQVTILGDQAGTSSFAVAAIESAPAAGTLSASGIRIGATPAEVVAIARAALGTGWETNGCAAFVWGVTNLAGLPFFDDRDMTFGEDPLRPRNDPYVVPHSAGILSGTDNVAGDGWRAVAAPTQVADLRAILQPGDVVRVYAAGNTGEVSQVGSQTTAHSFIVSAVTANDVKVIDNWSGGQIREHSWQTIVNSFAPAGAFESAFVSRIDAAYVAANLPATEKAFGDGDWSDLPIELGLPTDFRLTRLTTNADEGSRWAFARWQPTFSPDGNKVFLLPKRAIWEGVQIPMPTRTLSL